jgi:hypothetical protein
MALARLVIACALAAAVLPAACGGSGRGDVSASDIADDPDRYLGDDVVVEGSVSNPIDHRVWEIADGRIFVIYDRGLRRGLERGDAIRISGTVRPLEQKTIEGELGINIEDHFFDEPFLQDDVALVADDVVRLER